MTTSRVRRPRGWANPALVEAQRLLRLPRTKPTDADRPPVTPGKGPRSRSRSPASSTCTGKRWAGRARTKQRRERGAAGR